MTFDYDPKTGTVHYIFTGPELEEIIHSVNEHAWETGYNAGVADGVKNDIVKRMDILNKKRKEDLKTNG